MNTLPWKGLLVLCCGLRFAFGVSDARADETPHHSPSAVQAFNQGVQQFNADHFEDAISYFDQAISHDDDFAEAFYARAACHHALKQSEEALSDVNQAIRLKSDDVDAYSLRGVLYYESDQMGPAYDDFSTVLRSRPTDAQSLLGRGVIALKQDKLKTAQHDFRAFLQVRPHDPLAPRLHQLLASLSHDSQRAASRPSAHAEEQSNGEAPSAQAANRTVSAQSEQLAEELFLSSHQMSDSFTQKVLRGERPEAVGDINTVHHNTAAPKDSGDGLQIVEPQ